MRKSGMKYDDEFKALAVSEAHLTKDVKEVANKIGVATGTLYKWIGQINKSNQLKDYKEVLDNFFDLIEANHHDLAECFSESKAEERTDKFLKLCFTVLTGFRIYYKELIKEGKNNPNNEKSKFFKRFCYILYEQEDYLWK